jgi:hypothetical protein
MIMERILMKSISKLMIVFVLIVMGLSVFVACDDLLNQNKETADAMGRVANESDFDLKDIKFGDVEFDDLDSGEQSDYVGIPLTSERLEFDTNDVSGGPWESGRLEAPEKGKKYTIEIESSAEYSSYYDAYLVDFYYDLFEDGDMRRKVIEKQYLYTKVISEKE